MNQNDNPYASPRSQVSGATISPLAWSRIHGWMAAVHCVGVMTCVLLMLLWQTTTLIVSAICCLVCCLCSLAASSTNYSRHLREQS